MLDCADMLVLKLELGLHRLMGRSATAPCPRVGFIIIEGLHRLLVGGGVPPNLKPETSLRIFLQTDEKLLLPGGVSGERVSYQEISYYPLISQLPPPVSCYAPGGSEKRDSLTQAQAHFGIDQGVLSGVLTGVLTALPLCFLK